MQHLKARKAIAMLVAVALVTAAALVYAAWTNNGSGSGYAKAGTAVALTTADVSASTTASLYPGATGDVRIKINNPNAYPVRVTGVASSGTIAPDAAHAGCTTTGVSFTDQTALTIDIAANGAVETNISGAVSMSNASLDACQGATFTIPVTLTGISNGA